MANIDLDKPRYDQSTYTGRAKHFLTLTNPLNILASDKELDEAKKVVDEFRKTRKMPKGYDEDKLWAKKYLYDSAFHPDTGEKMFVLGRMAAQAPMNTLITGGMITFYKTTPATVFWQWINQTFNAVVNYTNRSGDAPISTKQLFASYCAACGGALGTALYLNSKVKGMKPLYARLVPFAAVCGANFINIPMMRSNELMNGTPVFTPDGQRVGESKRAAQLGIFLVCISRVAMSVPGMTLTPVITNIATKRGMFNRYPLAVMPFQLVLVGMCVTFATPLCCALFDQRATLSLDSLEPELRNFGHGGQSTQRLANWVGDIIVHKCTRKHKCTLIVRWNGKLTRPERDQAQDRLFTSPSDAWIISIFRQSAITPAIANEATQRGWFCKYPFAVVPFQLFLLALCVTFATPLCCALFKQRATMNVASLEPELRDVIKKKFPKVQEVNFNKGL